MKADPQKYIPAAGFGFLTRLYDPLVKITCRETYFKQRLIDVSTIRDRESILDVGCGTGTLLIQIGSVAANLSLHGLDGDDVILNIARAKSKEHGVSINWIQSWSTEIPLEDNSMDLVTNSLMIHHLMPDQKSATFLEIYRVLKPGGRLVLVDWGKPSNILYRSLFKFIRILDGHPNTLDHLEGNIPEILQKAGFKQVELHEKINTIFGTLDLITANKTPDPQ